MHRERERDRERSREVPPKVACLWVLIEWRRLGVSLMEWELLGCLGLMAIMRALKTMCMINAL